MLGIFFFSSKQNFFFIPKQDAKWQDKMPNGFSPVTLTVKGDYDMSPLILCSFIRSMCMRNMKFVSLIVTIQQVRPR